MQKYGQLKGIEFVDKVVEEFNVREHLHGAENIPSEGKFIFASNHPLGGFDGMLLMKNVEKRLGSFKFLSNDILLNIPQLSPVFVPVNKHGGHAREAAKMLSGVYESDDQVLIKRENCGPRGEKAFNSKGDQTQTGHYSGIYQR